MNYPQRSGVTPCFLLFTNKKKIADAWLNIVCAYRLEKKWDKAQEALNKAKALAPEDEFIINPGRPLLLGNDGLER